MHRIGHLLNRFMIYAWWPSGPTGSHLPRLMSAPIPIISKIYRPSIFLRRTKQIYRGSRSILTPIQESAVSVLVTLLVIVVIIIGIDLNALVLHFAHWNDPCCHIHQSQALYTQNLLSVEQRNDISRKYSRE